MANIEYEYVYLSVVRRNFFEGDRPHILLFPSRSGADHASSLYDVAAEHGRSRKHFSRLLRLAALAPDVVTAILDGRQPIEMSRQGLLAANDVPIGWVEQRSTWRMGAG